MENEKVNFHFPFFKIIYGRIRGTVEVKIHL